MIKPTTPTTISIDLKKYRIRSHKSTIHLLGDPKYIQLLVKPASSQVAIRAVEKETRGDQNFKVDSRRMKSDNSYELYSQTFITKLCSIVEGLEHNYTYRLTGEIIESQKVALFSLKTISRVEPTETDDEQ